MPKVALDLLEDAQMRSSATAWLDWVASAGSNNSDQATIWPDYYALPPADPFDAPGRLVARTRLRSCIGRPRYQMIYTAAQHTI